MTERNLIIRSHRDTRAALLLLAAFAVCLSAPELTDIRRPFHDTVGLFYGRILMTDAVRNGSLPLWYSYARYSIPYYSLEGGMGWSPIGFLVGAIAPYDLLSWALEGLLWNLICLGGTFAFARGHVSSPFIAAAIAMTYTASGLMSGSVPTIGTTRAFQIGPWAFVAFDTLVRTTSPARVSWLRGTSIFAVTGMLWITSGYPGIWLTAPVLCAPYAIMASRGRVGTLFAIGTAATAGGLLSLGMCSLLIDGTFNAPFFGEPGARPHVSPADNALQFRNLIHVFTPNPAYLRDSSGPLEPLYMGAFFLPGLLLIGPQWNGATVALVTAIRGGRGFSFLRRITFLIVTIAIVIVSIQGVITGNRYPWLVIWFGLGCMVLVSRAVRLVEYVDYALLVSTIFSIGLASESILGNIFRSYIPPFTIIRWNDWYTWVAVLCISTYVWRNIEQWFLLKDRLPTETLSFINCVRKRSPHLGVTVVGSMSLIIGILTLPGPIPVDYNAIHTLTLLYLSVCIPLTALTTLTSALLVYRRRNWSVNFPGLWAVCLLIVPVVSGMAATAMMPADVQSHRVASSVGLRFHMEWDLIQVIGFPLGLLGIIHIFQTIISNNQRFALIATGVALDMSLAYPRILSHTDYLRSGQIDQPTSVDRSFAFTGNERQANESTMSTGASLYNAFKKSPDQLKTPGTQPQMEMYDVGAGAPSPFGQFVWFPEKWSLTVPGNRDNPISDSLAELPGQPWPPAGASTISVPACGDTQPGESSGRISKLLPDRVVATIQADCARLVVLMDTWAPGWTVSVDGKPTQPIRVNGVLRGVEVPAGDHTIMWFYRPVHWTLIVAVTIGSLLITIALGLASIVLTRGMKVPLI